MRRLLMPLLVGGVVFAASAGGSWFLHQQQNADSEETGEATPEAVTLTEHSQLPPQLPMGQQAGTGDPLPVAVRPRPMSVEELLRHGMSLKTREEGLRDRGQKLDDRESMLRIMLTDLQSEQKDVEALQSQAKEQALSLKQLFEQVQQERRSLGGERTKAADDLKEIQDARIEVEGDQKDNLKTLSQWIQGMEPTKAAELLRELAEDGKMDLAVLLMQNLEDRDASKILSELDDATLVIELAEKFKNLKREKKPARRR